MLASTYLSPPFLPFHHHTATTTTTTTSAHLLSGDPNRRARRHMSGPVLLKAKTGDGDGRAVLPLPSRRHA